MSFCATAISARKHRGRCADPGHDCQCESCCLHRAACDMQCRPLHQWIDARDQINAGGHHGRGMNQRGDRRGAFHGIGQPDMQRELAALARRSGEDQQRDGGRCTSSPVRPAGSPAGRSAPSGSIDTRAVVVEEQRAGLRKQPHNAKQKEDVADARGEKRFLRRRRALKACGTRTQ